MKPITMRVRSILIAAVTGCGAMCSKAIGDTIAAWNGGNGSWTTASDWSDHIVPNNGGTIFDVTIDGLPGINSTVSIGTATAISVNSLQLDSGDALVVNSGGRFTATSLSLSGTLTANGGGTATIVSQISLGAGGQIVANGGSIFADIPLTLGTLGLLSVQSGGTALLTGLNTDGTTVTVGSGTLRVSTLTNAAGSVQIGAGGVLSVVNPYTLSSSQDIALQAGGSVGFATLNCNAKTFTASAMTTFSANQLNITSGAFTENGVGQFNSITNSGGNFSLGSNVVVTTAGVWTNTGGTISLGQGASLAFTSGTLTGGALNLADSASINILPTGNNFCNVGNFTLNGGALTIGSGGIYGNNIISGAIVNNGTINFGGGGAIGNGTLTLSGTGTYNFSASLDAFQGSFVNQAFLRGSGQICPTFGGGINDSTTNHGTIEAAVPAGKGGSQFIYGGTTSVNAADGSIIVDSKVNMILRTDDFTSTGSISIQRSGILTIGNGDSPAGNDSAVSIQNAGTLMLSSANLNVGSLTGGGDVQVNYFDSLNVGSINCASLELSSGCTVTLAAQPFNVGILADSVGSVTEWGGVLMAGTAAAPTSRIVAEANSLNLAPGNVLIGLVNLNNNDLIIHNGTLTLINSLLNAGSNSGQWNGMYGINSSAAAADPKHLAALGAISNSNGGAQLYNSFDNQSVSVSDVLVKFTIWGDNNLDGVVDLNDFNDIVMGLSGTLSGWQGGDYEYRGTTTISADFPLFLMGYFSQGEQAGPLDVAINNNAILTPSQKTAMLTLVPEPTCLSLMAIGGTGILLRRTRAKGNQKDGHTRSPTTVGGQLPRPNAVPGTFKILVVEG
jgi:hypothetical protein